MPNLTDSPRAFPLSPELRGTYAVVARAKPPRAPVDRIRVGAWAIALVVSLAAWAGIAMAVSALVAWL
jgi:hypothetical protein